MTEALTVDKTLEFLRVALNNPLAEFRSGQWDTIDYLVNHRSKILLVQRTGWGKSIVYFISARVFRDRGLGPTIIISPLLALMRNQIEAAQRIGIRAVTINSTNPEEWNIVKEQMLSDEVDVMLISPERLANDNFIKDILLPCGQRTALLVVDEAHCISDWGHDFRPDYRRIVNILRRMPPGMPVLGTTATANNRVINDIVQQLGDIQIMRGPLTRETLTLQNIRLSDQTARMAWLVEQIPRLKGTGIIYTLTKRDAEQVSGWLQQNGIDVAPYYSDVNHPDYPDSDTYRRSLEAKLLSNEIKALVATTALGMGYDKPDLGFVIHFQAPGSVIAYYQQVGRAGRAIDHAYAILLSGREDQEIHQYFREAAFPSEDQVAKLLEALETTDGLSINELQEKLNLKKGQIEHVLKFLVVENPSPVIREGRKWYRTAIDYRMDHERIDFLTNQRERERKEIQEYVDHRDCLMRFLRNALDDTDGTLCKKCVICSPDLSLPSEVSDTLQLKAREFLCQGGIPLKARSFVSNNAFPMYGLRGHLQRQGLNLDTGMILSRWRDAGWGQLVADNKGEDNFDDTLVDAAVSMIRDHWKPDPFPKWVTCVPSLNHPRLVPWFAERLARKLNIRFLAVVEKIRTNEPQKYQNNSFQQCKNLDGVFKIQEDIPQECVLLVDDIVDSGWTLTVVGALLRRAGCVKVYPMALATASGG